MSEGLAWPPTKEDLERLYLVERLSAAKIAQAYGLKYKNPKVAESTVLYQLKRNGIPRRDRAEHVRKVTAEMVDEWVRRYQAGESLKKIAGSVVYPVTVWNHLRVRGISLRDKIEAQIKAVTKHKRLPFNGDPLERAYIMGLRYGDLHVVRHGRAIRVRVSTTHPAMANLFESLFSPFGYVHRYPRKAKLTDYEWTLECDLSESFSFLLEKPSIATLDSLSNEEFLAFVAGIFDAEGTAHLHKKRRWYAPEFWITNADARLLECIHHRLVDWGYHPRFSWVEQRQQRQGIDGPSRMGHIYVTRSVEAQRLLRVLPIRHAEKIARRGLLLQMEMETSATRGPELAARWKSLSEKIRSESREFKKEAGIMLSIVQKRMSKPSKRTEGA